jgi:glycosyltransferase involved in cell wall biosynthesis
VSNEGKAPIVSVGMPVYNGERHIRRAIESILDQTFTDLELIISDNASTDGTFDICREYAQRDPRVRLEQNKVNRGSVFNDNRVLELSRGKYFKWASSNDLVAPDMIAKCVRVLEDRPDVVVCYCLTSLIDEQGNTTGIHEDTFNMEAASPSVRFQQLLCHMGLNNAFSGVIRTDVLRSTTFIGNYIASDLPVMAELALHGKYHQIPEPLFYRRMDDQSATVHKSISELMTFHDPTSRRRRVMKFWRLHWEYLRALHRVRIGLRERLVLYKFFLRFVYWGRDQLASELRSALRMY